MPSLSNEDRSDLDEIGRWSEIKLEIIRDYARAYSMIMSAQERRDLRFTHRYVDAFAGAGKHRSRQTGLLVPGSPAIALATIPPFVSYHFVDLDRTRVDLLEREAQNRDDVFLYHGDANEELPQIISEFIRWRQYERALVLLDPYAMNYHWSTVLALGATRAVDLFLNFPTMAINRNVLRRDPSRISTAAAERMDRFWGDASWRTTFFQQRAQMPLWGDPQETKVASNEDVMNTYRQRLRTIAGFTYVPDAIAMRNSAGSVLYFMIFATNNPAAGDGGRIIEQIFNKYR